ncbi:hypothetical protein M758_7G138000 [Ceratodon purpureus]|nr:hypothetical protein M758_7G138000 [Ceratodon purpureus]KAG0611395.1 hypothetical protein M758_7G138000 [Ceratodon purpureus]KAG0611396.1 hypothetical protein M758_7G138000 [Ceratodon purpureus]
MIAPHGLSRRVLPFGLDMAPASAPRRRPGSLLLVYASGKEQEPQPRRITKDVKRNLHLLKIFKEFAKKQTVNSARPTTSYRKKKVDKQDMPDGVDDYEDPTTKLYHTSDGFELAVPVLLVDGYNMCGYWPKLKKHFARGQLETARDKLIHELITFTHMKGVKVVCVFDAVMSGLPTHKEVVNSVDIVYSAQTDSDSWIEREVTLLRADGCPKVWVATSDTFHQQAAHGAVCNLSQGISCNQLFQVFAVPFTK